MWKFYYETSRLCCPENGGEGGAGGGAGGDNGAGGNGGASGGQDNGGSSGGNGGGTPAISWLPNATPEEIAFAQSKGWDKAANPPAEDILRSYHNLQKLFGADKAGNTVVLPAADADAKTLDAFYNKLGRPETADKYTAETFKGMDDNLNKSLREKAHALGISDKQLKGLQEWNNQAEVDMSKRIEEDARIESASQATKLKTEWGAAFDANLQVAQEATKKMGWTKDQVDAMQIALGYDGVMKLAYDIGKKAGEGTFVNGDNGGRSGTGSDAMTPEQAKKELEKLMGDDEFKKAWMDKNHPKHQWAMDKKSQLTRWSMGQK